MTVQQAAPGPDVTLKGKKMKLFFTVCIISEESHFKCLISTHTTKHAACRNY